MQLVNLTNLISRLRLDSTQGNAKNIWLTLILIFLLVFMNYRSFVVPEWLLQSVTICIATFQIVSLFSYGYWTRRIWRALNPERRLSHLLYFRLLVLVTLLASNLTMRVVFHNG